MSRYPIVEDALRYSDKARTGKTGYVRDGARRKLRAAISVMTAAAHNEYLRRLELNWLRSQLAIEEENEEVK